MTGSDTGKKDGQKRFTISFRVGIVLIFLLILYTMGFLQEGAYVLSLIAFSLSIFIIHYMDEWDGSILPRITREFEKGRQESLPEDWKESSKGSKRAKSRKKSARKRGLDRVQEKTLKQKVRDKMRAGWKISEIGDNGEYVVMYTAKGGGPLGHGVVGALTGLWTFGAGNVAYQKASKRRNRKKIVLRATEGASTKEKKRTASLADVDSNKSAAEKLRELKDLRDDEVISEEEFMNKKEELLEKI